MKSLSLRCMMRETENLKDIINELNLEQILIQFNLIIYNYDIIYPNFSNVNNDDKYILRFFQNFINNIAKFIGEEKILEIYNNSMKNSDLEDKYIIHWIHNYFERIKHLDEKNANNINEISNKTENSNISIHNSNSGYNENNKDKNNDEENNKKITNNKKDNEKNLNDEEDDNNKNDNVNEKGKMIEELKNKWNNVKPK